MTFTPKTAAEIALDKLFIAGIYPFSVMKTEEKTSKAGNEMIALTLCFYGDNGRQMTVFDYLMGDKPEQLEQFCRFTGLADRYASGMLTAEDCDNREGYAKLKIQPAKGDYEAKNAVSYYCGEPEKSAGGDTPPPMRSTGPRPDAFPPGTEDEIPF